MKIVPEKWKLLKVSALVIFGLWLLAQVTVCPLYSKLRWNTMQLSHIVDTTDHPVLHRTAENIEFTEPSQDCVKAKLSCLGVEFSIPWASAKIEESDDTKCKISSDDSTMNVLKNSDVFNFFARADLKKSQVDDIFPGLFEGAHAKIFENDLTLMKAILATKKESPIRALDDYDQYVRWAIFRAYKTNLSIGINPIKIGIIEKINSTFDAVQLCESESRGFCLFYIFDKGRFTYSIMYSGKSDQRTINSILSSFR